MRDCEGIALGRIPFQFICPASLETPSGLGSILAFEHSHFEDLWPATMRTQGTGTTCSSFTTATWEQMADRMHYKALVLNDRDDLGGVPLALLAAANESMIAMGVPNVHAQQLPGPAQ